MAPRVSPAFTVYVPVTGAAAAGATNLPWTSRTSPIVMRSGLARWLIAATLATVVPYSWAIRLTVSPACTVRLVRGAAADTGAVAETGAVAGAAAGTGADSTVAAPAGVA